MGETAILPLVGRRLRIIADEYVKPEFGTGALKITPGHDPNDFEIGRAHGLDEITVIGEDGRMTEAAGERFAGMTALEAREAVVAALREEGRIARTEPYTPQRPVLAALGRADRAADLAAVVHAHGRAGRAGDRGRSRDGRVRIHPEGQRRALPRVAGEHPPVVHLAPAVVGPPDPGLVPRDDETYVGMEPPEGDGLGARPRRARHLVLERRCGRSRRSAGPTRPPELQAFYPTDVLSTARDILFLWVARMVMMGLEFAGDIPFERRLRALDHPGARRPPDVEVARHRDRPARPDRRRPAAAGLQQGGEFPAYGADAVRFGLLAMSSTQDVRFNEEKIAQGRQLANKLFNAVAARAAARARGRRRAGAAPRRRPSRTRWILSRLQAREGRRRRARSTTFEFHRAALGLYDFVYGELCDWYLEMVKPRLYADDNATSAAFALHVLAETLALAHPVIPFVTEEIWSYVPGRRRPADGRAAGPTPDEALRDEEAEARGRRARSPPCRSCAAGATASARRPASASPARLEAAGYERTAEHVARLARVEWSTNGGEPVATVGVPAATCAVLASEAVDLEEAAAQARAPAQRAARRRSSAPRASSPTRASSPRRPRPSCRPSATSSSGCSAELEAL